MKEALALVGVFAICQMAWKGYKKFLRPAVERAVASALDERDESAA